MTVTLLPAKMNRLLTVTNRKVDKVSIESLSDDIIKTKFTRKEHDDPIQILLILSQFLTLGTETKLEGFVWSHRGITELISRPKIAIKC